MRRPVTFGTLAVASVTAGWLSAGACGLRECEDPPPVYLESGTYEFTGSDWWDSTLPFPRIESGSIEVDREAGLVTLRFAGDGFEVTEVFEIGTVRRFP